MTTAELRDVARRAGAKTKNSPWVNAMARVGLAAKGFSFVVVGFLAAKLAVGDGGAATSREGAIWRLAGQPFGEVMLAALAFGLAAYAFWQFVRAIFDKENKGEGLKGIALRTSYFGRGLIYSAMTWVTLQIVLEASEPKSQNEKARDVTRDVLGWPGGRWLVAGVGVAIAGVGLYNGYRGLTQKFEEKWETGKMSRSMRRWAGRIGTIGMLARLVVFGLIGWFLVKAAVEYDPKDAIGLDGALQKLAQQPYGPWLLGLTAAGLIAYGAYCFVEARYRRV